jgi:dipeptidyl aminopeptidase/acylaminoacyl peptidase
VFELNVVTGALKMRQPARAPIRHWIADNHGQVRLGWGLSGATISHYARLDGEHEWRRLTKFEVFSRDNHFDPIAISGEEANKAYAYGSSEGRKALWLIDLTDKEDPSLVFAHPAVDEGRPLIARDGRLLGIHYDTGYPMMYYTDERIEALNRSVKELVPGKYSSLGESTRDENVFIVRSYSDLEPSSFRVFDVGRHSMLSLGSAYPDRDASTFAPMRSISYPARDGTPIPAFLSTPPGKAADLPLIVMPHGGPIARDSWGYFFLREFLVSRGYAVLQMNFRGSSGYGDDWFFAAHQDWGGLTYDDVVDGTKWAIQQKIADPRRVCIVGWSFGGYLALLGAQRNADLFRCSVDIAGVSDLGLLIDEGHNWLSSEWIKKQIGTDPAKLKLNSPRIHAAEFDVPLLMLHGDSDAQVPFEQSEEMHSALKRAGKAHRFVAVPDADHQFSAEKDRATLLRELEAFLADHLGAIPGH